MNPEQHQRSPTSGAAFRLLEHFTAAVLLLVLGTLAWMTFAAYWPGSAGIAIPEWQVIGVIVLLLVALGLVSIVALLHTRK